MYVNKKICGVRNSSIHRLEQSLCLRPQTFCFFTVWKRASSMWSLKGEKQSPCFLHTSQIHVKNLCLSPNNPHGVNEAPSTTSLVWLSSALRQKPCLAKLCEVPRSEFAIVSVICSSGLWPSFRESSETKIESYCL